MDKYGKGEEMLLDKALQNFDKELFTGNFTFSFPFCCIYRPYSHHIAYTFFSREKSHYIPFWGSIQSRPAPIKNPASAPAPTMNPNLSNPTIPFTNFFHLWLMILETHVEQLFDVSSQQNRVISLESVIEQVLRHYRYFDQYKSDLVGQNDVLLLLSAPWLTTFERTFIWLGGSSKPSSFFPTLRRSVGKNGELSGEQVEKVRNLEAETMRKEKHLNEVFAINQESIMEWMKLIERIESGAVESRKEVYNEERKVADRFRAVVSDADLLRDETRRKLVDILNPTQAAKFLTEVAKGDLRVRSLGLEKDGISSNY